MVFGAGSEGVREGMSGYEGVNGYFGGKVVKLEFVSKNFCMYGDPEHMI